MSSAECLLKLLGALSFEGHDECSSSILYHFSLNCCRENWVIGRGAHWEIRLIRLIRARRFRTSCLPTRCVQMKSNACVKVDVV